MMRKIIRFVGLIIQFIMFCFWLTSCEVISFTEDEIITYSYEEINTDLVKAEIVNCSSTNEQGFHIEVIKTLSNEECDYAIAEITEMKFERVIVIGEPYWPRENVLIFYYPSYELWFYSGRIYKASNESETGVTSYHVNTEELEELIDHLLHN